MSSPPGVATDRGLGIAWWHVVAVGTVTWWAFLVTFDVEQAVGPPLVDTLSLLAVVAWPVIPVAMYLDLRSAEDELAWEPATTSWLAVSLLPLANAAAGLAYCLRRRTAIAGELPSANWRYGVYAGLLAWIGVVAADVAVDTMDIGVIEEIAFGPLLAVVWFGYPVALYLDAERMRFTTDLSPNVRALVALSVVPLLNVVVGAFYVAGRWWHRRTADPDAEPTLPGRGGGHAARRAQISPWYRRAVGVFLAYSLLAVALASWLSLESDLEWAVLSLVVWPPFGLAFVTCFHLDNRAVREAGVPWGPTRYLYYSTAAFSGPAFWYLLSRLTKVERARSRGLIDAGVEARLPPETEDPNPGPAGGDAAGRDEAGPEADPNHGR